MKKSMLLILSIFFITFLILNPSQVYAETKELYVSATGEDNSNGSLDTPLKTLKKALELLNTDDGIIYLKDSIVIDYKAELANGNNVTIKSLSDTSTITWDLNQDNNNDNDWGLRVINNSTLTLENIILDGEGTYPKVALVYVDKSALNISENTILRNQKGGWFGGGVRATYSTINMTAGKIENNSASAGGGGISLENSELKISGGEISNNESIAGAGIYALENSQVELSGSTKITKNTSTGNGGGIFLMDSNLTISDDVLISENTATDKAGGIGLVNGTLIINGATIKQNTVNNLDGGGIWLEQTKATITEALIEDNKTSTGTKSSVSYRGGGIFAYKNSEITLDGDITIKNNTAVRGGGLYVYDSKLYINNANIIENTATANGGGIYVYNTTLDDGETIITRALISKNKNTGVDVDITPDYISDTEFSGGGMYIGENTKVTIYNVAIKNNSTTQELFLTDREKDTGLYAGGLAFCPNAKGYVYMTEGAAIYNNVSSGGYDILLVPKTSKLPGGSASLHLSKQALAGGTNNWYDINNTKVSKEDQLVQDSVLGYTSKLSSNDINKAETQAKVIISDNITNSIYGAGGIMCNGYLTLGKVDPPPQEEHQKPTPEEEPKEPEEQEPTPDSKEEDDPIPNPDTGIADILIISVLLFAIIGFIIMKKLKSKKLYKI